jgi:hypothetical protein
MQPAMRWRIHMRPDGDAMRWRANRVTNCTVRTPPTNMSRAQVPCIPATKNWMEQHAVSLGLRHDRPHRRNPCPRARPPLQGCRPFSRKSAGATGWPPSKARVQRAPGLTQRMATPGWHAAQAGGDVPKLWRARHGDAARNACIGLPMGPRASCVVSGLRPRARPLHGAGALPPWHWQYSTGSTALAVQHWQGMLRRGRRHRRCRSTQQGARSRVSSCLASRWHARPAEFTAAAAACMPPAERARCVREGTADDVLEGMTLGRSHQPRSVRGARGGAASTTAHNSRIMALALSVRKPRVRAAGWTRPTRGM